MKTYSIFRHTDDVVWLLSDDAQIPPDRAHLLLGPIKAAYNFGYAGEGPRVLALALLLDSLNNAEAALDAHGHFAAEFLNTASASAEELRFSQQQILDWFKGYAIGSAR